MVKTAKEEELSIAISEYDSRKVEALLSKNKSIDVNVKDEDGHIPLHIAIAAYNQAETTHESQQAIEIIKLLIKNNADFTIKDAEGLTSVHLLAWTQNTETQYIHEILKLLPDNVLNIPATNGKIPLHYAAVSKGNRIMIEHLIKKGSNVNAKDVVDHTPLQDAMDDDNAQSMDILLKKGVFENFNITGTLISKGQELQNMHISNKAIESALTICDAPEAEKLDALYILGLWQEID
ncbi:MAG TPA: ankyrin repeat domain-containing protein [Rickettsia endosymbiont of Pyrocoelia pectoralis]|nr:ankyrin repeat domain-containing protein [Rickettsia endosymbiont of Pyrocoelia pectoralis]